MTWFAAGAAAVTVATSLYSASSAGSAAAKAAGEQDAAQGAAVVKERLNKTVSNSYATAFSQMRLSLQKRQLAQQDADISAASLAAKGQVQVGNAATSSIGATTQQVSADIQQKVDAAHDQVKANWQNDQENYNNELSMMVINTNASEPNLQKFDYNGPSGGEMLGGALLSGAASFASNYASAKMKLGSGTSIPTQYAGDDIDAGGGWNPAGPI